MIAKKKAKVAKKRKATRKKASKRKASRKKVAKKTAKKTTKSTYVLITSVNEYRNYREHPQGDEIAFPIVAVALATCIELLACLQKNAGYRIDELSSDFQPQS